ncbi:MAG: proline--tRNA ligase, partial [Bacilli bacterium]
MKQSLLFVPTLRDMPKEAEVISHKILLRGGYIKQSAAGVYSYLPLGYKIIKKIEHIIREELDKIGC